MFSNWLREHFKDEESARTTIAMTAIVGGTLSFLVFMTAVLLGR